MRVVVVLVSGGRAEGREEGKLRARRGWSGSEVDGFLADAEGGGFEVIGAERRR